MIVFFLGECAPNVFISQHPYILNSPPPLRTYRLAHLVILIKKSNVLSPTPPSCRRMFRVPEICRKDVYRLSSYQKPRYGWRAGFVH